MIKTIDRSKLLEATNIILTKEDVKRIEEIVNTIQAYAIETENINKNGEPEEPFLSQIRWLRSLYHVDLSYDL